MNRFLRVLAITFVWGLAVERLSEAAEPAGLDVPAGVSLPSWLAPSGLDQNSKTLKVGSGELELTYSAAHWGKFSAQVNGKPFAIGQDRPMVGYLLKGTVRWFDLAEAPSKELVVRKKGKGIEARLKCKDGDGAEWEFSQSFVPGSLAGCIDVSSVVRVDQERAVIFLPMLMVFAGASSFGKDKGQGLFAGLEYLENEPSSSEADVIGPASKREVPDSVKITFPLMAIQAQGQWLGLAWEPNADLCAFFDSPDRTMNSGGHAMGLLFPGSSAKNREDGSLLPRKATVLKAGQLLVARATLMGGKGESIGPAISQYVALRGLPPMPQQTPDFTNYVSMTGSGWLDSKIHVGHLFRHAIAEGNFNPQPAADAAVWMDWLANRSPDNSVAERLRKTSTETLEPISRADLNSAGVGHVRFPLPALVYGSVSENAARANAHARSLLGRFEADGSVRYHPASTDLAKTHYTNEATGLASAVVRDLLDAAVFVGDRALINQALDRLRALNKFRNGVPRGAQTWECPLHTPDILASAQMVRAYTLGYELTGETDFLEQAKYWAWTGVPFVYLVNPADKPIGLYGTIAVFGATQWKAPVWLGMPVQWCGLVYADALYRLVRDDPKGPWKTIADGITASGIQQSWPDNHEGYVGLLPDSFVLRGQHRNGPSINPATLQACAVRYFVGAPAYDFHCFRQNNVLVHAPGEISAATEGSGRISFEVQSWVGMHPYYVLINGLKAEPRLELNGKASALDSESEYHEKEGWLILHLNGTGKIGLEL